MYPYKPPSFLVLARSELKNIYTKHSNNVVKVLETKLPICMCYTNLYLLLIFLYWQVSHYTVLD